MAGNSNSGRRPYKTFTATESKAVFRANVPHAISQALGIMKDLGNPAAVRLDAIRFIVEQALGKPTQAIQSDSTVRSTVLTQEVTEQQREAILALAAKYRELEEQEGAQSDDRGV